MRHPLDGPTLLMIYERETAPASCAWCRTREPNGMLLNNNHYPDMGLRTGTCIAQHLTRNHVTFAVQRLTVGTRDRFNKPAPPLTGEAREWERKHLTERIERATNLWSHTGDTAWLDEARDVIAATAPIDAPDHHEVRVDAEEVALW